MTEQAILTCWYDLFRTGALSRDCNLADPKPSHVHLTHQGRKALENLSRDLSNPEGYLAALQASVPIESVAGPYVQEALSTTSWAVFHRVPRRS